MYILNIALNYTLDSVSLFSLARQITDLIYFLYNFPHMRSMNPYFMLLSTEHVHTYIKYEINKLNKSFHLSTSNILRHFTCLELSLFFFLKFTILQSFVIELSGSQSEYNCIRVYLFLWLIVHWFSFLFIILVLSLLFPFSLPPSSPSIPSDQFELLQQSLLKRGA